MIKYSVLLLLLVYCNADSNVTSLCSQKERFSAYLEIAVDMITKAKNGIPTCETCANNLTQQVVDCADIFRMGHKKSGVYKIWPMNRLTVDEGVDVYCDMETDGGGWTLIQRRGDYKMPKDSFHKDWKSYKEGFGDIETEFWLGNDNIFALTNQKLCSVRFDLEDVENNKRYAHYDIFWIDDEYNNYRLHISDFSGDAVIECTDEHSQETFRRSDSMTSEHNTQKFSTKDKKNDNSNRNCAQLFTGGWWFKDCRYSNLNGLYLKGNHGTADGVSWYHWKGYEESLLKTEIKIRPKTFSNLLLQKHP